MNKKFLVIDDECEQRRDVYCDFFDFLNLDFANNSTELEQKIKMTYDGYILDVLFQNTCYNMVTFDFVVEKLKENKPIFIVSSDWKAVMDTAKMNSLTASQKYKNILGYFSWNSINNENANIIKDFAKTQLMHYYEMSFDNFEISEEVLVLQISDLEFGNKTQTEIINASKHLLINEIRTELSVLAPGKDNIDFLAICGDIAFTGNKSEYLSAKIWIEEFAKTIMNPYRQEKILIVPGNHDFNIDSSAGCFYSMKKKEQKFEFCERTDNNYDCHDLGFNNFACFARNLIAEPHWLNSPNLPLVIKRFEQQGINFILLNGIMFSNEYKFKYNINDEILEHIFSEFTESDSPQTNIVLSHVSPMIFNQKDTTSTEACEEVRKLVEFLDVELWLHGHQHGSSSIDSCSLGRKKGKKTHISKCNTLLLDSNGRHQNTPSGYSLFKLVKENGVVKKIEYLNNETQNIETICI